MNDSANHKIIFWDQESDKARGQRLVGEEPLSIRLEGKPYSVIMRTPGEETAHAAVLYTARYELLSVAEDVGRHNALDKAIGKALLEKKLESAALVILSSRISYELVQKAARALIPSIFALSRPTALAVDLATQLNMTLATLVDGEGLYIFCGAHRLKVKKS